MDAAQTPTDTLRGSVEGVRDVVSLSTRQVSPLIEGIERLIGRLREARKSHGLTAEELTLYLAVGRISLSVGATVTAMRPVSYIELSDCLLMPRETVRRKAARLIDRRFLLRVPHGVLLRELEQWAELARHLLAPGILEDAGPEAGCLGNAAVKAAHKS